MRQSFSRRSVPVSVDVLEDRRLMSVTLPAGAPITIGTSSVRAVVFTATNGRTTFVGVGHAEATLQFVDSPAVQVIQQVAFFDAGDRLSLDSITLSDAVPHKASLTITSTAGPGTFNVGSITGGDLASITARAVNLTGSLAVSSIKNLTLASVSGAAMNLGDAASTIMLTGSMSGSLTASGLKSLSADSMSNEHIATTGVFSKSQLQIAAIKIAHGIDQSSIASAGNIGAITAASITDSSITAAASGVAAPQAPTSSAVFSATATIHSVRVPLGHSSGSFDSSVISAYDLGDMQLGELDGGNGGIAAHTFGSLAAVGPSGGLDRVFFHLGGSKLRSTVNLQAPLTKLGIPFTIGNGSLESSTAIYGFDINLL